jgi:hypothetical protein
MVLARAPRTCSSLYLGFDTRQVEVNKAASRARQRQHTTGQRPGKSLTAGQGMLHRSDGRPWNGGNWDVAAALLERRLRRARPRSIKQGQLSAMGRTQPPCEQPLDQLIPHFRHPAKLPAACTHPAATLLCRKAPKLETSPLTAPRRGDFRGWRSSIVIRTSHCSHCFEK